MGSFFALSSLTSQDPRLILHVALWKRGAQASQIPSAPNRFEEKKKAKKKQTQKSHLIHSNIRMNNVNNLRMSIPIWTIRISVPQPLPSNTHKHTIPDHLPHHFFQ